MNSGFQGKVAFVAGAGGGIGLNIANDLIAAGARVVLADIKPQPGGIAGSSSEYEYVQGDLTDEPFVKQAVASALTRFGQLDYLVNTLGVLWFDRDCSLLDMDMNIWDEVMTINVKAFALTARHAIPAMRATGGGAIVNFSSIDALCGDSKPQDAYGASKAAVRRLSKSIAVQFAKDNIRSNCILPGPIMSPLQERWEGKPDVQAEVARAIPLAAWEPRRTWPTPVCFCCRTTPRS